MITLPSSVRIYLAAGAVDPRKSIDGLGAIVSEGDHDLYSGHLYVFVSRRGDRLKILTWSTGGFLLLYNQVSSHCTSVATAARTASLTNAVVR